MTWGLGLLLTALTVIPVAARAQTRVDNPRRALAKDAGRVVQLEEVLRIRDDGDRVIFKVPREFALGPDGSLCFYDIAEGVRLYRFGPDGKLIFKSMKTGQGPGECLGADNFVIDGYRLRVQAWNPPKIMDFGFDGRYRSEIPTESTKGLHSLFLVDGRLYGLRDEVPYSDAITKTGLVEAPYRLYELSSDLQTWKKLHDFPVRHSIRKDPEGRSSWIRLDMIDAAAGGPYIYIVHAAEYRIDQFDRRTGRVERVFGRAYDRRRLKAEGDEDLEPGAKPEPDDSDVPSFDVLEIHVVGDRLWAFTSTMSDRGNDRVVDIFDAEGRFVDCVVLAFPDRALRHHYAKSLVTADGSFVVAEQDRDGLVSIGKYRVPDAGLFPTIPRSSGGMRIHRPGPRLSECRNP
jgi:hypothetical protein